MQNNGLAWFLNKEVAKSLIFHLVFRRSISAHISTIMADFAPHIFRNVPHPPAETLAFVGASVSSILEAFLHLSNPVLSVLQRHPPVVDRYFEGDVEKGGVPSYQPIVISASQPNL
jgi:hypothetical protein